MSIGTPVLAVTRPEPCSGLSSCLANLRRLFGADEQEGNG